MDKSRRYYTKITFKFLKRNKPREPLHQLKTQLLKELNIQVTWQAEFLTHFFYPLFPSPAVLIGTHSLSAFPAFLFHIASSPISASPSYILFSAGSSHSYLNSDEPVVIDVYKYKQNNVINLPFKSYGSGFQLVMCTTISN